jgi:predicted RNA polymerase sigma factor
MDKEQQAADKLYKSHFGKMVTAMLQFSRDIDVETAEDLVQDAFYAALSSWKHKGIPDNPAGWMYTVCRNNAINVLNKNKSFKNPLKKIMQLPGKQNRMKTFLMIGKCSYCLHVRIPGYRQKCRW